MLRAPLFIVGSPRSGTSAMVDVAMAAGYQGYREGMFLSLLTTLSAAINRHFDIFADPSNQQVLISTIDREELKNKIFQIFKNTTESHNSAVPWLDKTGNPEMIEAIPLLRTLWPDAIFIFCKRRGIENVVSRMRKFPMHNFEYHCRDWARNMTAWRNVRDSIPESHRREIDQQDMIQRPDELVEQILSFIEGDSTRRELMERTLRNNRPQQTETGSAAQIHSLETTGWNATQIDTFRRFCGAEMEAYGYTMNSSYWE